MTSTTAGAWNKTCQCSIGSWLVIKVDLHRVWVADITCAQTRQGWLYLATVLDMHNRYIVGWAMGDRADQTLASRKLETGAIHHSDCPKESGSIQSELVLVGRHFSLPQPSNPERKIRSVTRS